jgi:hypothetical protein
MRGASSALHELQLAPFYTMNKGFYYYYYYYYHIICV